MLDGAHPDNGAELARLWPLAKFPLLLDGEAAVMESSIIIEHLDLYHPGPVPMIPVDPEAALQVRKLDRIFDNHVMTPMQRVVADALRGPERHDPAEVADAKAALARIYAWLDDHMTDREWASGHFSIADCAAAPALFYADWVHPIPDAQRHLRDYRARLLSRPSVVRAVDEARPYRAFFPLGAPDRD
jgi:glutathione S-transferase